MTMAARKLRMSDQPDRVFDSLDALMAEMANGARIGARAMLQTTPEAGQWPALERDLERWIGQHHGLDAASLDALSATLLQRVQATFARHAEGAVRQRAFSECISTIDEARSAMLTFAPADAVAHHVHAVLVWYCAWHLTGAAVPVAQARAIIADTPLDRRSGGAFDRPPLTVRVRATQPAVVHDRVESVHTGGATSRPASMPAAAPPIAASPNGPKPIVTLVVQAVMPIVTAAQQVQRQLLATTDALHQAQQAALRRRAKAQRRRAIEAAQKTQEADPVQGQDQGQAEGAADIAISLPVNGSRLTGSVFGTWVMLVVLSWVSLLWGALLSVPFGIGLGILSTFAGGIIAVPLWATFWGFLGLGNARQATLRHMKFEPMAPDHALMSTCARFCQQLEMPVPQLGTIPVHNAFAMGVDHRNATVAIGRPLLSSLTPAEINAVLGHELGHIVSGDMRRMMLMRTFQNATVWYAGFQGLKHLVRGIICWGAELAILAFSRRREYWADAIGAALAGKEAMISALRKLDAAPKLSPAEHTHARFMFRGRVANLSSTHPTTHARIWALENETYIRRLPLKPTTGMASSTAT